MDTESGRSLQKRLPFICRMYRWGEELYSNFGKGSKRRLAQSARQVLRPGELGYWIEGKTLCLFFGEAADRAPDPSRSSVPVIPVGRIDGPLYRLRVMKESDVRVTVRLAA